MEKEIFNVPNISCGHCVNAIKNELSEIKGVQAVEGDPEAKTITVSFEAPASPDKVREALRQIDYPAK